MNARETELLDDLATGYRELYCKACGKPHERAWFTPMMVGGRDGSHHSATLKRLAARGLVETKHLKGPCEVRGCYWYRLAKARPAIVTARSCPR